MIPKNLIVCSFGNQKMRPEIEGICEKSRQRCFGKDWNLIFINEDNFDVNQFPFTKAAYEKGFYSFVVDYVRTWALIKFGGVYLDTDVLMLKELDGSLLNNKCFIGSCVYDESFKTYDDLTSWGLVGSEPNGEFMTELLDRMTKDTKHIEHMHKDYLSIMKLTGRMLRKRGLTKEALYNQQVIDLKDITVYPFDRFTCCFWNTDKVVVTDDTYCMHLFGSSWQTKGYYSRAAKRIRALIGDMED